MAMNVLTSDIRKILLVPVLFRIENQERLAGMCTTEGFATQIDSELERHVESRQSVDVIELRPRKIVDRVTRHANELNDLMQPHLTRIEALEGAPCLKAEGMDAENDRLEDRRKYRIEWTIDENVPIEIRIQTRHYFANFPRSASTAFTAS